MEIERKNDRREEHPPRTTRFFVGEKNIICTFMNIRNSNKKMQKVEFGIMILFYWLYGN